VLRQAQCAGVERTGATEGLPGGLGVWEVPGGCLDALRSGPRLGSRSPRAMGRLGGVRTPPVRRGTPLHGPSEANHGRSMTGSLSAPSGSWARRGRRILGGALLFLAYAPIYRLMDTSAEAPHRQVSVEIAEVTLEMLFWGTVTTVLLAWLLARLAPSDRLSAAVEAGAERLARIPTGVYAAVLAVVATSVAAFVGVDLYKSFFTNVDEIASTLHARYLAAGMLAGPTHGLPEFWLIPNTLVVPEGWVSQFPPTHLVAMAALSRLGAPTLLGPLAFGTLAGLVALSLPRLLPDRPRSARVAALTVTLCPFLVFLGGGSMSHVTAGAGGAAVLYLGLRSRDGSAWWAVPAGGAVGLMVADRPLVGLVLGTLFTLGVWLASVRERAGRGWGWLIPRMAGTVAGGAPFAFLLGAYNDRLFGSPTTFGYLAAFGDRHRLGFHMDPWGYAYTLREAVAFTSTDVLAAGVQLLESPFPITALLALWLLLGTRIPRGAGLLLAWAFLPVLANAFYWFHDVRMLSEAAPAWLVLTVLATADLSAGVVEPDGRRRPPPPIRDVFTWAAVVGVLGAAFWGVPTRYGGYRWTQETLGRITAPVPPSPDPAIIFVHVSWNERLSATLQGAGGMRQDSLVSALRRNTNCALYRYAVAREARAREGLDVSLPDVDLEQAPGTHLDIERPPSPSGATFRVRRSEPFPDACRRQVDSDRFGAVALAPLVWQGDLPGIERGRPLYVRDLGPDKNERLLEAYPDRTPWVFTPTAVESAPELLPYGPGMDLLWGVERSEPER
jgi:hypothetical protein